ncbi:MAG TPA: UxaA family hydrolase [Bacillota bacterium]|nr:UxaA family hydrolase [Bacillota bacterium]HOH09445.1 UxaA family hydrolase [Bacillota bacterium]HOS50683.1 UxaA family hydrolase [Bacillota bacterium]HOY89123.1 UxaA family hydrolase [Bacillota bacterium]HPI00974.1 UxaA family hydrolase [Bacillota bacterium]
MAKALEADSSDNVATVLEDVVRNQMIEIAGTGRCLTASCDISRFHKVATADIPLGRQVVKYGQPIGCATADIHTGEHVHVHNMASLRARRQP